MDGKLRSDYPIDLNALEALAGEIRDDVGGYAATLRFMVDLRYYQVCRGLRVSREGGLDRSANRGWTSAHMDELLARARAEAGRLDRFLAALSPADFAGGPTFLENLEAWVADGMPGPVEDGPTPWPD